jgi:aspartate racemase
VIIESYRAARPDGSYPHIVIDSINLQRLIELVTGSRLDELATYLAEALARLAAAGADVALLASNTPHLVFDELRRRSPVPLISIVEAACAATRAMGLTRVALFGTRFTMEARFYPDVFEAGGIALMVPSAEEREYIHGRYMDELIHGRFLSQTREAMTSIVDRLVERHAVQAVVLGGTELPLLFRDGPPLRVPLLDTMRIHAARAVAVMLATLTDATAPRIRNGR